MTSVSLRGVRKYYDGSTPVIKGVDLEIASGEFMVFVGQSGCGKSTMMRMIAGLEDISEGELRIGNRVANDLPPVQRDVAMVFQSYALYPHMTVAENMGFGLKISGRRAAEVREAVGRAAQSLRISHLLDRRPKALSGGERQRVAIGRAIVRKPKVFLFDEPLSNLDAGLRVQMRLELTRLHQELGATMIYVTHDQTEAMTMGDRIAVFNKGIVQQVGAPLSLYQRPANVFVAQFLGSPKMNVLQAAMRAEPDGTAVVNVQGLGEMRLPVSQWTFNPGRVTQVGVRPESLEVGVAQGWEIDIALIERLGEATLLYGSVAGAVDPLAVKLTAEADRHHHWTLGQRVRVRPRVGSVLAFDASGVQIGLI